jgi:SAM-dependent methyltransferase
MKHANLASYDNVENLKNFTEISFHNYCQAKLKQCDKHIDFIRSNCIIDRFEGRFCEVGSGNSKLLYRLEAEGMLEEGIGYEISKSRHLFAEKFKTLTQCKKTINKCENILESNPLMNVDCIIAVDVVFQLITPLYLDAEMVLLEWVFRSLKEGGFLILELWDFKRQMELIKLSYDKVYKSWEEFSEDDPFQFSLFEQFFNPEGDIVWKKRFIKRDSKEVSEFENILRPYSFADIKNILLNRGFKKVTYFDKWSTKSKSLPGEYIVLAKK